MAKNTNAKQNLQPIPVGTSLAEMLFGYPVAEEATLELAPAYM